MNAAMPAAEAMLVEDGRIAWVGQLSDMPESAEGVERLDLNGKVVVPGFVEPHMHLPPLAMMHAFSNIGPNRFDTAAEALAQLAKDAAATPAGEWVVGRQFDPSLQSGPDYLTADMLDEVSTDHPVFVYNTSLHLGYCNSVALTLAGIDADTPDPQGAEIGRDADGNPNGVLKAGPAMALVVRHNSKLKHSNIAEGCLSVLGQANAVGITTLCDQGTGMFQGVKELDVYQSMRNSGRMTCKVSLQCVRPWPTAGTRQNWSGEKVTNGSGEPAGRSSLTAQTKAERVFSVRPSLAQKGKTPAAWLTSTKTCWMTQ